MGTVRDLEGGATCGTRMDSKVEGPVKVESDRRSNVDSKVEGAFKVEGAVKVDNRQTLRKLLPVSTRARAPSHKHVPLTHVAVDHLSGFRVSGFGFRVRFTVRFGV